MYRNALLAASLLIACLCACSGAPPSVKATATSVSRAPGASPTPEPEVRFSGDRLERVDPKSGTVWSTELPAETNRELAVLGNTVLVWGPSNNLRRFDLATGEQTDITLAQGEVTLFEVHDNIMVQSSSSGLSGIGEKEILWNRFKTHADSMVVGAGPPKQPVVLLVSREDGKPGAVSLADGKDASFPLPEGSFVKVEWDRAQRVVIWTPKGEGGPVRVKAADGTPAP